MGVGRKNLFLVVHNHRVNTETFTQVAAGVEAIAPHIRARVVRDKRERLRKWGRISRPSFTVSLAPLGRYRPLRGAVMTGQRLGKIEDMRRLEAAGVPVPRWTLLEPDKPLDLSDWGPYVVLKPIGAGKGAGVKIKKRGRVRYKPVEDDLGERVAQEFVYTGRWPVSYRVSVFFGRVLFCLRQEGSHDQLPLEGPDRFGDQGGLSIVASRRGCTYRPVIDEEVMALAVQASAGFPDVPLLGLDIVREHGTGRLFVLETNPSGYTWLFSSEAGRQIQQQFGFSIDEQMGGLSIASRVLAEETDARAR